MHLHIVPNYDAQTLNIQHMLNDCEDKLSSLAITVYKQRWEQLPQQVQRYESAIQALKENMKFQKKLPPALLSQFQHISTQQRRVMRSISQHMQQTADDINSIDQGITKLKQTALLQASLPPRSPLQK